MPTPIRRFATALLSSGLLLGLAACIHVTKHEDVVAAPAAVTPVARGQYIVMNVAACVTCHRATLPADMKASRPGTRGPDLGKLDAATLAQLSTMLETGEGTPRGMPQFTMKKDDVAATVAFLKSLNPTGAAPAGGGGGGM